VLWAQASPLDSLLRRSKPSSRRRTPAHASCQRCLRAEKAGLSGRFPDDDAVGVDDDLVSALGRAVAEETLGATLDAGGAASRRSGLPHDVVLEECVDAVLGLRRSCRRVRRSSDQERDWHEQCNREQARRDPWPLVVESCSRVPIGATSVHVG
jgi:hypothetical protein